MEGTVTIKLEDYLYMKDRLKLLNNVMHDIITHDINDMINPRSLDPLCKKANVLLAINEVFHTPLGEEKKGTTKILLSKIK